MTSAAELFPVLSESEELLVINKPAGLVCHPTKDGVYSSLISRVRLYLGPESSPHLVNRLDRETSGVVLVAKTDLAALELRRIWESRKVEKEYLAICRGRFGERTGTVSAPLGKDPSSAVAIKHSVQPDGAAAETSYQVEREFVRDGQEYSLVRVQLKTGRKHQIRIHLAHLGCPIVGDKIYGGDENLYLDFVFGRLTDQQRARLVLPFQALHAALVQFEWRGQRMRFAAEPESWFVSFLNTENSNKLLNRRNTK